MSRESGRNRYNSESKADILSRALGNVLSEKRGSSTVSKAGLSGRMFASTGFKTSYRDIDSQANRFRATINQLERLQAQGYSELIPYDPKSVFPTPVREPVFA